MVSPLPTSASRPRNAVLSLRPARPVSWGRTLYYCGMDERTVARIAHNEARYRKLNEEIRELVGEAPTRTFEIVCECGSLECRMLITVTADAYRNVRSNPRRFFVRPGHEIPEVETVVDRVASELQFGTYLVVEKAKGVGREIAEATSPEV